jgi:hypothetical protein
VGDPLQTARSTTTSVAATTTTTSQYRYSARAVSAAE